MQTLMVPYNSTTAASAITTQGQPPTTSSATPGPAQVLEISIISAQDLTPLFKSMRTYAVTWINPTQKLTTRTDQHHTNPTWNDKFTFNVDIHALYAVNAALHVEIYAVSWFRHVLVGSVKVLVSDLLARSPHHHTNSTRFVALQVRRPSGTPQGILNLGVTFHDHSLRAMFRQQIDNFSDLSRKTDNQDDGNQFNKNIQLWRRSSSESEINPDDFPLKAGSVCNNGSMLNDGSMCNDGSMLNGGSELCSDIGPSASIVAAELASKMPHPPPHHHQPPPVKPPVAKNANSDDSSSIVEDLTMEEAIAKGYKRKTAANKWQKVVYDNDRSEVYNSGNAVHSRRNSDGGLFSCFVYGMEFRIARGAGSSPAPSGGVKHSTNSAVSRRSKESN